ncbi:MAG TPA: hypothetical protein VNJ09_04325 [Chthonomonadales bacterium]|nr:hypothetical protein [Chthonomonadales bacterium]
MDDFNAEALGLNQTLDNWDIIDGSVDVIGDGVYDFYPGHGRYLDMDGSTGNAATIVTKSSFGAGDYTLMFSLAGNARGGSDSMTVSLGPYSEVFNLAFNAPFTVYTRDVTLTSSSKLMFDHAGGDNSGIILDDVKLSLRQQPPPPGVVPEPSALLFGIAGCLAAASGICRRQKG